MLFYSYSFSCYFTFTCKSTFFFLFTVMFLGPYWPSIRTHTLHSPVHCPLFTVCSLSQVCIKDCANRDQEKEKILLWWSTTWPQKDELSQVQHQTVNTVNIFVMWLKSIFQQERWIFKETRRRKWGYTLENISRVCEKQQFKVNLRPDNKNGGYKRKYQWNWNWLCFWFCSENTENRFLFFIFWK